MKLQQEDVGRYINFKDNDGEIIVSVDPENGQIVTYEKGCDEPESVWNPVTGWTR